MLFRSAVTNLGTLPGAGTSSALAINENGGIVGSSGHRAFMYRDGSMIDLGNLGNNSAVAADINDSFQVVGSSSTAERNVTHGFLWESGVMTDLGVLVDGGNSEAWSINNQGTVVGRAKVEGGETHNFVYQGDGLVDTGTGGGRFANSFQVLDDGTVVGFSEIAETREDNSWRGFEYHAFIFMVTTLL